MEKRGKMKKFRKTMALLTMSLLVTGCTQTKGSESSPESMSNRIETSAETAETEEKEEPVETSVETVTQPVEEQETDYEDPKSLPVYTYQGDDEYLGIINDYLISTEKEAVGLNTSDVYIPFSVITKVDDSDSDDIIAYGSYNIFGYDLLNTTLFGQTGSMCLGAIHLKTETDGTYTVTKADLPFISEESEEVFAPVPGLFDKTNALVDSDGDIIRASEIAEYVKTNNLNITQWQDYGHAPVAIEGVDPTPEKAQFYSFESPLGYKMTYDLRELSLLSSEDDLYGKVGEDYSGTLMVIKKVDTTDADAALTEVLSNTDAGSVTGVDTEVAGISCRRVTYDEQLEDGRIFRYVCYAVDAGESTLVITLDTTVEKGVSEMSVEELEKFFEPTLSTFSM